MQAPTVGKNDPCPCGSGKKYRQCCWQMRFSWAKPVEKPAAALAPHPPQPNAQPKRKVRSSVTYQFSDGMGIGTVSYLFELDQKFFLVDRRVLTTGQLAVGDEFYLEGDYVAKVTDVEPPVEYGPPSRQRDEYGNTPKRVLGTVRYSGHYPVIDLIVGELKIETTPGHPFYSLDRGCWVEAETLEVGERIASDTKQPVQVTAISPYRMEQIDLYNFEVEDFHTYFVGRPNETNVWSHNSLNGGCPVPKPKQLSILDDLPDGPVVNGTRILRKDQVKTDVLVEGKVVSSQDEIKAVIGAELVADGSHKTAMSGLYSFIRQNGGAGFQGVTRNPLDRIRVAVQNFKTAAGDVIAAIDLNKIASQVFDLCDASVKKQFLDKYPNFKKMFNKMADEGVVAVRGNIPVDAVTALVRVPKNTDARALQAYIEALVKG